MNAGPNLAWSLAVAALGEAHGSKLPQGLTTLRIGDWTLTVNNSKQIIDDVEPFGIHGTHQVYLRVAVLSPSGGMIGGCTEDTFIADMRAAVAPETSEAFQ